MRKGREEIKKWYLGEREEIGAGVEVAAVGVGLDALVGDDGRVVRVDDVADGDAAVDSVALKDQCTQLLLEKGNSFSERREELSYRVLGDGHLEGLSVGHTVDVVLALLGGLVLVAFLLVLKLLLFIEAGVLRSLVLEDDLDGLHTNCIRKRANTDDKVTSSLCFFVRMTSVSFLSSYTCLRIII